MNGSIPDVRKDSLLRRICNPAQQELRISESAKSARTFQRPHASKQATHRNCFLGLQILIFHCVGLQIPRSVRLRKGFHAATDLQSGATGAADFRIRKVRKDFSMTACFTVDSTRELYVQIANLDTQRRSITNPPQHIGGLPPYKAGLFLLLPPLRRICNPAQQELRISESAKSARTFQRPRGACGQHIGIVFSDYKS